MPQGRLRFFWAIIFHIDGFLLKDHALIFHADNAHAVFCVSQLGKCMVKIFAEQFSLLSEEGL